MTVFTMIPKGSLCGQDFSYFYWPRKTDNPNQFFKGIKSGSLFTLVADGYGEKNNYGSGAITVHKWGNS